MNLGKQVSHVIPEDIEKFKTQKANKKKKKVYLLSLSNFEYF